MHTFFLCFAKSARYLNFICVKDRSNILQMMRNRQKKKEDDRKKKTGACYILLFQTAATLLKIRHILILYDRSYMKRHFCST